MCQSGRTPLGLLKTPRVMLEMRSVSILGEVGDSKFLTSVNKNPLRVYNDISCY
jgi:hypothetical protein